MFERRKKARKKIMKNRKIRGKNDDEEGAENEKMMRKSNKKSRC